MRVQPLAPDRHAAWDAFVQACPEAGFTHLSGWREVIERAFGHRTHYLLAEDDDGGIRGVLPLAEVRSRLFGYHLVSTPFCVYGGPAAVDDVAYSALAGAACDLARALGVDDLELRNLRAHHPDWPAKDLYVRFRKAIDPDPEVNLKAIPRKQRAMVRKGIKAGLEAEESRAIDRFFPIYAESVRNLGTPVFGRRFFQVLWEVFGEHARILMVRHQGRDIAGVLSFYFRDEVLPYYGGSLPEARVLKGNDFMYWELMRRSALEGIRWFDYGRSKVGTGAYHFKKNWGFEPEPLAYEYCLVRAREIPQVNPNNPKYRHFIDLWRRLPLPVANALGPRLAKYLG